MAFEIIGGHRVRSEMGVGGIVQKDYIEAACLSSDTKLTEDNYATGSICVEADTGKVFFYNDPSKTWVEQFSFKG